MVGFIIVFFLKMQNLNTVAVMGIIAEGGSSAVFLFDIGASLLVEWGAEGVGVRCILSIHSPPAGVDRTQY